MQTVVKSLYFQIDVSKLEIEPRIFAELLVLIFPNKIKKIILLTIFILMYSVLLLLHTFKQDRHLHPKYPSSLRNYPNSHPQGYWGA